MKKILKQSFSDAEVDWLIEIAMEDDASADQQAKVAAGQVLASLGYPGTYLYIMIHMNYSGTTPWFASKDVKSIYLLNYLFFF